MQFYPSNLELPELDSIRQTNRHLGNTIISKSVQLIVYQWYRIFVLCSVLGCNSVQCSVIKARSYLVRLLSYQNNWTCVL